MNSKGQLRSRLQEHLTCPVCYCDYDDDGGVQSPKLLECGHGICQTCLQTLIDMNRCWQVLSCPVCRHRCPISAGAGACDYCPNVTALAMCTVLKECREEEGNRQQQQYHQQQTNGRESSQYVLEEESLLNEEQKPDDHFPLIPEKQQKKQELKHRHLTHHSDHHQYPMQTQKPHRFRTPAALRDPQPENQQTTQLPVIHKTDKLVGRNGHEYQRTDSLVGRNGHGYQRTDSQHGRTSQEYQRIDTLRGRNGLANQRTESLGGGNSQETQNLSVSLKLTGYQPSSSQGTSIISLPFLSRNDSLVHQSSEQVCLQWGSDLVVYDKHSYRSYGNDNVRLNVFLPNMS